MRALALGTSRMFTVFWCRFCWPYALVRAATQVELVADSLEGMERLLAALGKSKSKSKRDDVKLHASLAEVNKGFGAQPTRVLFVKCATYYIVVEMRCFGSMCVVRFCCFVYVNLLLCFARYWDGVLKNTTLRE